MLFDSHMMRPSARAERRAAAFAKAMDDTAGRRAQG